MGHDAKVSLKHYAQTTEDHFDRATGGAKCGALASDEAPQQLNRDDWDALRYVRDAWPAVLRGVKLAAIVLDLILTPASS
jgi:hypothetical protein